MFKRFSFSWYQPFARQESGAADYLIPGVFLFLLLMIILLTVITAINTAIVIIIASTTARIPPPKDDLFSDAVLFNGVFAGDVLLEVALISAAAGTDVIEGTAAGLIGTGITGAISAVAATLGTGLTVVEGKKAVGAGITGVEGAADIVGTAVLVIGGKDDGVVV